MAAAARGGRVDLGAVALLALFGVDLPSAEQQAGALLLSSSMFDLHVLAAGKQLKE